MSVKRSKKTAGESATVFLKRDNDEGPIALNLLPGEIIVGQAAEAKQLIFFTETSDKPCQYVSGTLICTNYRLSFNPAPGTIEQLRATDGLFLALSSSSSIPMTCVDQICLLIGGRRKLLGANASLPSTITEIELTCKDLRRFLFDMRGCKKSDASTVTTGIARHSQPATLPLLFAFEYALAIKEATKGETYTNGVNAVPSFLNPYDWEKELSRLGITNDKWRVTDANKRFTICPSLCPYFVCPANINDTMLEYAAVLHVQKRLPVWCWSHPQTGVSLTRTSAPVVEGPNEAPDPGYVYAITAAQQIEKIESRFIEHFDINAHCGSVKDVAKSFSKLQELCMPFSIAHLGDLDKQWLSGLGDSGWYHIVSSCLDLAKRIATTLCINKQSAMIFEDEGRDLSCLISSLVQVMVDPYFRSISGFETLIQKEWVAMGYCFATRHHLVLSNLSAKNEEDSTQPVQSPAPVFLLFMDCILQLSKQFPSAFEFSETYILHLYDLTNSCLYGNFIFDSIKERVAASNQARANSISGDESLDTTDEYEGPLLSAWNNWRTELSKEENECLLNPFYYIFGSSDAPYDCKTGTLPFESARFNCAFDTGLPDLALGGNLGLYRNNPSAYWVRRPLSPSSEPLLLPNPSLCQMQVWAGFFFRFIPGLNREGEYHVIQEHYSRMVREVRKLKDLLNAQEMEANLFASDLSSIVADAMEARELEVKRMSEASAASVDDLSSTKTRPFTAVYQQNEAAIDVPSLHDKSKSLPSRSTAQFSSMVGRSPRTRSAHSPGPTGKSPISKTKVRVTRTQPSESQAAVAMIRLSKPNPNSGSEGSGSPPRNPSSRLLRQNSDALSIDNCTQSVSELSEL